MFAGQNFVVGSSGESAAVRYLKNMGYEILAQNVRMGHDEIDIVAMDTEDGVVVFAEVKTRSKNDHDYWPSMNMTWKKKSFMRRAARKWMARAKSDFGYRMDLVCVAGGEVVDHIKSVGWHDYQ